MKFIPDKYMAEWLTDFVPDTDNFDWDEGNMFKNFKHDISTEDIESIFWQPA